MKLKYIFCKHNYKRTSEIPKMVPDEGSMCSYEIELTCKKCGKVKDTWSDMHLGMMIVESTQEKRDKKLEELGI